jgi:nucleotide-binding universal stress UspA family protein
MVKDIIVNLSVGKPHDVAGDYALSVASVFDAHLSGVACAYEPVINGMAIPSVAASLIDTFRAESEAEAHRAKTAFEENARRAIVSADSIVISGTASDTARKLGELARDYDLSIVAQAQDDGDFAESMAIEGALFGSGRPVLVVPYIQSSGLKLDRVMVCWDGSRNAARAVGDAMPFLRRAGTIEVVTIERQERRNELTGARIAAHLARHGMKVELKPIVAPDVAVADAILSFAADNSTDLIVMGGYGHTRLREFVLGGATSGILDAMTVPTLMSH